MNSTSLPSPLPEAGPHPPVVLPHASWGEARGPLLQRFAEQARAMRPVQRISYEPLPLWMRAKVAWSRLRSGHEGHPVHTLTWHVPVNEILDGGVRREMLDFAHAMYHYELPPGDPVILTGMLDGPGADGALLLFGGLAATVTSIPCEHSSPT